MRSTLTTRRSPAFVRRLFTHQIVGLTVAWIGWCGWALPACGAESFTFQQASIEGLVTGEGQALADAKVRLDSTSQGSLTRTTTTSSSGRFRFAALDRGEYSLSVSLDGFVTSWIEEIEIEIGESLSFDFDLVPGRSSSVTVTSMPRIDTTSATGRWSLTGDRLQLLPSMGLVAPLLALSARPSRQVLFEGIEIGSGVEYLPLSMVAAMVQAPLDSSAELSLAAGPVIDVLTRRPGSSWHGSAEVGYGQGDAVGNERPDHERVRGGTAAGGPLATDRLRLFAGASTDQRSGPDDVFANLRLESRWWQRLDLSLTALSVRGDDRWESEASTDLSRLGFVSLPRAGVELSGRASIADQELRLATTRPHRVQQSRDSVELRSGLWSSGFGKSSLLTEVGGAAISSDSTFAEHRRRALWLEQRWRWKGVSVRYGLRTERLQASVPLADHLFLDAGRAMRELLPRVSAAWDLAADGQTSLYVNAAKALAERRVWASDRLWRLERQASLGLRHQLLPGVVIEAELHRHRPDVDGIVDCEGGRKGARLGVLAEPFRRITASFDYAYSGLLDDDGCESIELARPFAPSLVQADTTRQLVGGNSLHRISTTATLRLDRGFEAGLVVRYLEGGLPGWRALAAQAEPEVDLRTVDVLESAVFEAVFEVDVFEVDLALGYSFEIPKWGEKARLTFRAEVLDLFDRGVSDPWLVRSSFHGWAASAGGGGIPGRARLLQEPRRLWFGARLAL